MNFAAPDAFSENIPMARAALPKSRENEDAGVSEVQVMASLPLAAGIVPGSAFDGSFAADTRRRWAWPLLASVALHLGVAGALMVHWSFSKAEDQAPPAAMVVELAVMPASPPVQPNEIPPGPQQVKAAAQPKQEEKMKFDPPPKVDPVLKPSFALPPKEEQKPVETQVAAKPAPETTAPQAVQAPVQAKQAAPVEGNNAAPPSDAEQAWEGRLLAKIERNKRYPSVAQNAGQQDTVFVRLVIDRKGRLVDATLKKSAGFALLDAETLALAKRASPFPPPPDSIAGDQVVRVVPVEFYIKKNH